MSGKKKDKSINFLAISMVAFSALCVVIFIALFIIMNRQSSKTIHAVGENYMSGISEQLSRHFKTAIELHMAHMETLVEAATPLNGDKPLNNIKRELSENARGHGFDYLAFISDDGNVEKLYGKDLRIVEQEKFIERLKSNDSKVTLGVDSDNNNEIMIGIPIDYPMAGDNKFTALVGGMPTKYLTNTLDLYESPSKLYSFIIRRDGSYVIRSNDAYRDNYFERVYQIYEDVGGKTADEYIAELQDAMDHNNNYSSEFQIYGEHRRLYMTKLEHSDWYLISFMPFGIMSQHISDLRNQFIYLTFGACVIILIALIFIYSQYLKMLKKQIKELEKARIASQKATRAKSEFLSNMSHDIRTPMNAIVGMTAIAKSNIDNKYEVKNCLHKIDLSSRHLLGLINNVLDMSKIESGNLSLNIEDVSLKDVMDNIVNIVQSQIEAKNQNFEVLVYDIITENVFCDSVRLHQVILNFLSNAIKFTPEGGNIKISLYEEDSPEGDNYVRLHLVIKDNGIGMTEEFKKVMFDSFVREDNYRVQQIEGTGLGMAITKYILDAMKGDVDVISNVGEGTQFHVTIDFKKSHDVQKDMKIPDKKALMVTEGEQLCESVVENLNELGIKSDTAVNVKDAVELAKKQKYNIVIFEWNINDMDSIEAARIIRNECGDDIIIILTSVYDCSKIANEAREAGINGFISMPLFKSTLYNGIMNIMENNDEAAIQPEDKNKLNFNGRHILLAEDNELNWEISEAILSDIGLEVEWAQNGQICVEKFQNSDIGWYDAILMDIRMPVMTGYEATKVIRGMNRDDAKTIPIIAITADAFSDDIDRCLDAGMNAHIAKPIDIQVLMRQLRQYIK